TPKTSRETDPPLLPTVPLIGPVFVVHEPPELLPLLLPPPSLLPPLPEPELPPDVPELLPEPPPEPPPLLLLVPPSSPKSGWLPCPPHARYAAQRAGIKAVMSA